MKKNKLMGDKKRQDAVGAHSSEPRKVHPDLILVSQNDDHCFLVSNLVIVVSETLRQ